MTASEIETLENALNAGFVNCGIRLRVGEYQYQLAEAIASFQMELLIPNVKEIVSRLYGEERAGEVRFIRKIQTILKKMERSNIVKILPRRKPWELQTYALSSFKFLDADKSRVVLATEQQIEQTQNLLRTILRNTPRRTIRTTPAILKIEVMISTVVIILSYIAVGWTVMQPKMDPFVFIIAFSTAMASSVILGKLLSLM